MSNATLARHNAGFQYRLRFFHKCRAPGGGCDPSAIDRFQIQGSVIESTCGSPIIVVLVRYRHDPESGLSRECQRAQFAPGAASFAVKAIVVPADQVLSYMDQPLLQQPRLVDSQGRNLLGGPDVGPDGSIYATPLERNGIAHLSNFCLMHPYTGQEEAAAFSGSGLGLGGQQQCSGSGGGGSRVPEATRRVRAMLGSSASEGGALGYASDGGLAGGIEVIQDSADVLSASSELCLLVQLLRRDPQRPGQWFAYDMPHLVSRPFQVVPRSALHAMQSSPGGSCSRHLGPQEQLPVLAPGRGCSMPRHSAGMGLGVGPAVPGREAQLQPHPQPFMSPQYRRQHGGSAGGFGPVPTASLAAYGAGPSLPSRMGVMGAPQLQPPQECGRGFVLGAVKPMGGVGMGMGGMGMDTGMGGMGMGMAAAPGGLLPGRCSAAAPVVTGGGGGGAYSGGAGFGAAERGGGGGGSGGGGLQPSMSVDSPQGSASQRGPRLRRRSCLSKDTSHDDSSVGAPSGGGAAAANALTALRTPSITSGMNPTSSGGLRSGGAGAPLTAAAAYVPTAGELGMAAGPAPSPPFSPPSRLGAAPPVVPAAVPMGVAPDVGPVSLRSLEGGRLLPLRQAPSGTLLDLSISDLLNEIQPQPLLADDMMELEEGAPKRVRANLTTSDVAAFMSDNTSCSQHLLASSSPRCAMSVSMSQQQQQAQQQTQQQQQQQQQHVEAYLARGGGGGGGRVVGVVGSGYGQHQQQAEGLYTSRADSWSAELAPEQLLELRNQSTGFSGNHAACFAAANGSTSVACDGVDAAAAAAATCSGEGPLGCEDRSADTSASQLDLLVQLLGQPGAMQDALDRMEQEQQQQGGQQQGGQQQGQDAFVGVAQPEGSGGEAMMQV